MRRKWSWVSTIDHTGPLFATVDRPSTFPTGLKSMNKPSSRPESRCNALAQRYGMNARPDIGPWNDHIELLLSHRSIRSYRSDPVPEGTLETLVAAAQSAATSSNMQLWSVIVIDNPDTRDELAKVAGNQDHIRQCPLYMVWLTDLSRNQRLCTEEGVEMESIPYVETFLVASVDAALAAQNAVTAAESLGLSTVYIGAMRNDPARVAELLGLPAGVFGLFGLCVGYAAPKATNQVKPRLPQGVVVHRETYGSPQEQGIRARYDDLMTDFSRRNEMVEQSWTTKVLGRMGKLAGMNGRETLSTVLHRLGFRLQ